MNKTITHHLIIVCSLLAISFLNYSCSKHKNINNTLKSIPYTNTSKINNSALPSHNSEDQIDKNSISLPTEIQQKNFDTDKKLLSEITNETRGKDKFDHLRLFEMRIQDEDKKGDLTKDQINLVLDEINKIRNQEKNYLNNELEKIIVLYENKNKFSKQDIENLMDQIVIAKDFAILNQEEFQKIKDDLNPIMNLFGIKEFRSGKSLFSNCYNTGRTKLWGQLQIDSDLMNNTLNEWHIEKGNVSVAVLDTGFSVEKNRENIVSPKFDVVLGYEPSVVHNSIYTDSTKDEGGHGTAVAGLIGAKGGIGIAPLSALKVYKITTTDIHSSNSSVLRQAIKKACLERNEIINVSFGNRTDEAQEEIDEVTESKLIEDITNLGCIIVKSAGNDSFIISSNNQLKKPEYEDDSYLRVASSSPIGELSDFSTLGEVVAPGDNIFTLSPEKEYASLSMFCGNKDNKVETGQFISGTSFSAPVVSAILANTLLVLKSGENNKYNSLKNTEKVKLLNRIIRASKIANVVNGLKAIWIAKTWKEKSDPSREIPSVQELISLLKNNQPKICTVKPTPCAESKDEKEIKKCIDQNRTIDAICDSNENKIKSRINLFEIFTQYENLELAATWFSKLSELDVASKEKVSNALIDLWNGHEKNWKRNKYLYNEGYDFFEASSILPTYIDILGKENLINKQDIESKLNGLVNSSSFNKALGHKNERGGYVNLSKFKEILKTSKAYLSDNDLLNFLSTYFKSRVKSSINTDMTNYVEIFKILNMLIESSEFNTLKQDLEILETKYLELSFKNFNSSITYRYDNDKNFKYWGQGAYNSDRDFIEIESFKGAIERNLMFVQDKLQKSISKNTLFDIPTEWHLFFVNDPKWLPKTITSIDYFLKLLTYKTSSLSLLESDGENNFYFDLFNKLNIEVEKIKDEKDKELLKSKIQKLILNNINFNLNFLLLPKYTKDRTLLFKDMSLIFDHSTDFVLAKKTVTTILNQDSKSLNYVLLNSLTKEADLINDNYNNLQKLLNILFIKNESDTNNRIQPNGQNIIIPLYNLEDELKYFTLNGHFEMINLDINPYYSRSKIINDLQSSLLLDRFLATIINRLTTIYVEDMTMSTKRNVLTLLGQILKFVTDNDLKLKIKNLDQSEVKYEIERSSQIINQNLNLFEETITQIKDSGNSTNTHDSNFKSIFNNIKYQI